MRDGFQAHLRIIVVIALLSRLTVWLVVVDHSSDSYAEYGIIARYMSEGKGYSCFAQTVDDYSYRYQPNASPQPSAFMMPGYTLFIYSGMWINNVAMRSFFYCFLQTLASLAVILLLYNWIVPLYGRHIAVISCWIYALLPEFIIAANTYSSVVFVHLCVIGLFYSLHRAHTRSHSRTRSTVGLIICAFFLCSLRAESLHFLLVLALYYIIIHRSSIAVLMLSGALLFLVPWTIRNEQVFHSFVPLTTSGGINLYRGHNPYAIGVWSDDTLRSRLRALPFNERIEIAVDSLHRVEALRCIAQQPVVELQRTGQKLVTLLTIDLSDKRSLHPAYMIPSLVFMLLVVSGVILMNRHRIRISPESLIYFWCCVVTTTIFFCLPRYQSMMRIVLVPIAAYGVSMWRRTNRSYTDEASL